MGNEGRPSANPGYKLFSSLRFLWLPNLEQVTQVGHSGDITFQYYTFANKHGFYACRLAIVLDLIADYPWNDYFVFCMVIQE